MSLQGLYIIHPKNAPDGDALLVGPIPLIFPPPDVPVRVGGNVIDKWDIIPVENNTYDVFTSKGSNDFRWIKTDKNELFVSSVSAPDSLRFEPAGHNLYVIGVFSENLLLTYDATASPESPPLTFRPADGSDAQRFELIRIDRD